MKVDPGLSLSGVPGDVQDVPGQVHRLRRPDRPRRTQRRPRSCRKSHFFTRVTVVVTKPITILVTKSLICLSITTNCCWPYSLLQSFQGEFRGVGYTVIHTLERRHPKKAMSNCMLLPVCHTPALPKILKHLEWGHEIQPESSYEAPFGQKLRSKFVKGT